MKINNLEYTAEDLISHKLQRNGILIAKPKFDINGADLIAFIDFNKSVKFGRIQCKGRTLLPNSKQYAKISIPSKYVYDAFFVFIYFNIGIDNTDLYLFTTSQIKQSWKINSEGEYYLNIKYHQLGRIKDYLYSDHMIENIRKTISGSRSSIESLLITIVKKQKEQIDIMEKIQFLQNTVLEHEKNKIIVENCVLEIEKNENELSQFLKEQAAILPKKLIDEIKQTNRDGYKISGISNEVKEKCIRYIEKEYVEDVIKYILK